MRRAGVIGAASAAAALAIAAGAGPAPAARQTSPRAWTHTVCTSVVAWDKNITKRAAGLSKVNGRDVAGVKAKLVAFLSGVVTDTQALISTIDKAGTPSGPHGADTARALHRGLAQTKKFFALDVAKAKKLPTKPRSKFAAGAGALGSSIDTQGSKIGAIFSQLAKKYPSPAFDKALKSDPACKALG
jgi:hypothetical protein